MTSETFQSCFHSYSILGRKKKEIRSWKSQSFWLIHTLFWTDFSDVLIHFKVLRISQNRYNLVPFSKCYSILRRKLFIHMKRNHSMRYYFVMTGNIKYFCNRRYVNVLNIKDLLLINWKFAFRLLIFWLTYQTVGIEWGQLISCILKFYFILKVQDVIWTSYGCSMWFIFPEQ